MISTGFNNFQPSNLFGRGVFFIPFFKIHCVSQYFVEDAFQVPALAYYLFDQVKSKI